MRVYIRREDREGENAWLLRIDKTELRDGRRLRRLHRIRWTAGIAPDERDTCPTTDDADDTDDAARRKSRVRKLLSIGLAARER